MVASDRISAYDVILPTEIPDKGKVLTQMSLFWFELTGEIVPNHFISQDVPPEAEGRGMRVRKLEMYPVECVVRGYLSGSGWREYRESGAVCGIELPEGLQRVRQAARADLHPGDQGRARRARREHRLRPGRRDHRRPAADGGAAAGLDRALQARPPTHAAERGIILADTKFEFGSSPGAEIVLGDEVLTPDSSRFWPADDYEPGRSQASFDKQYVRDYSTRVGWDHTPPGARAARRGRRRTPGPSTSRPTSGSPAATLD